MHKPRLGGKKKSAGEGHTRASHLVGYVGQTKLTEKLLQLEHKMPLSGRGEAYPHEVFRITGQDTADSHIISCNILTSNFPISVTIIPLPSSNNIPPGANREAEAKDPLYIQAPTDSSYGDNQIRLACGH